MSRKDHLSCVDRSPGDNFLRNNNHYFVIRCKTLTLLQSVHVIVQQPTLSCFITASVPSNFERLALFHLFESSALTAAAAFNVTLAANQMWTNPCDPAMDTFADVNISSFEADVFFLLRRSSLPFC